LKTVKNKNSDGEGAEFYFYSARFLFQVSDRPKISVFQAPHKTNSVKLSLLRAHPGAFSFLFFEWSNFLPPHTYQQGQFNISFFTMQALLFFREKCYDSVAVRFTIFL